jgi:hypothetical protein
MACKILVHCGPKMPLVLKRNDHTDAADRLLVYSGKAVVGTLSASPLARSRVGGIGRSRAFTSPRLTSARAQACRRARKMLSRRAINSAIWSTDRRAIGTIGAIGTTPAMS